jgi:hypothetical protein
MLSMDCSTEPEVARAAQTAGIKLLTLPQCCELLKWGLVAGVDDGAPAVGRLWRGRWGVPGGGERLVAAQHLGQEQQPGASRGSSRGCRELLACRRLGMGAGGASTITAMRGSAAQAQVGAES